MAGKSISTITSPTRRGSEAIILVIFIEVPSTLNPWVRAAIPTTVMAQTPKEVASRSVGEKASPLPWLSIGASVIKVCPDLTCVASVRKSPVYITLEVSMGKCLSRKDTKVIEDEGCRKHHIAYIAHLQYFFRCKFKVSDF